MRNVPQRTNPMTCRRRMRCGQMPLRAAVFLAFIVVVLLAIWMYRSRGGGASDGRKEIVCWGITFFGDDIYTLVHEFELRHPQYKVVISASVERDTTSDGQRLLCAIAGDVPPDVVFFPRHATGEWACRGALADLRPMIEAQDPNDPDRIDLNQYYPWALAESSYARQGSTETPRLYAAPVTPEVRVP